MVSLLFAVLCCLSLLNLVSCWLLVVVFGLFENRGCCCLMMFVLVVIVAVVDGVVVAIGVAALVLLSFVNCFVVVCLMLFSVAVVAGRCCVCLFVFCFVFV